MFISAKASGDSSGIKMILYPIPIQVFFLAMSLIVFNHYYSQMNSFVDNKGIHWKTLISKRSISWSQVVSLNLLNLRGGEKALMISSKKDSFKIELPLVKDPNELLMFVQKNTNLRIVGAKGIFM